LFEGSFLMQNVLFLLSELVHEILASIDSAPFVGIRRLGIVWLIGHTRICWQNH
jgi:hypothetical protein